MSVYFKESSFPALYQAADKASLSAQATYFLLIKLYLILLVVAAIVSFYYPNNVYGASTSAAMFLITLGILVWLKTEKPEDTWYNGRAVAESVKTRTWRWIMRAHPYDEMESPEQEQKELLADIKAILEQNTSLSKSLNCIPKVTTAITEEMKTVRALSFEERLAIYKSERIDDQCSWYFSKAQFNKKRATMWFIISIILHAAAVGMLLYRISTPEITLPIEILATGASAVLTWLQAKKHNELKSSYALAAHEIVLIKGEADSVKSEKQLSDLVINSETAFSREHTQWVARKND